MAPPAPVSRKLARIVIRLPHWLGDLLMARPCVFAMRAAHPGAEIRAAVPGNLEPLVASDGVADRIHSWKDRGARNAALAELRAFHPDAVLVLPPSFSSAWWSWRLKAPARVGFRHEGRGPLLTHALERPARGDLHLSDEYLALARVLGAAPVAVPAWQVPTAASERAGALIRSLGLPARYVVLGPGAIYGPAKRWSALRFAELGTALAARGLGIAVCGTGAEGGECRQVAQAIGDAARSLAGTTDLVTQAALNAAAVVAVCNDSGLAHLAAAVGTPTVAIFGSTSSAWTAPLGPRVRIVQHAPPCSPCFRRTCRIGYRCLTAVTVRDVLTAVDAVAD